MEPALQRRVQRYGWDKAAAYYQSLWQQQLKPAHDMVLHAAKINPGEKIIDIASGTGLISFRALNETGKNGFVLGTDISDRMVEISNEIAIKDGLRNIRFERMDAEELKTEDVMFDIAICALGLMYVVNPVSALKEMHRVLKTGGRCAAAVWGKRSNCGWSDIFEIVDKRVSSEVCPMFFNLGNDGMLEKCFEAAGFSNVHIEKINSLLHYDSAEDACAAAFEGGPVALAYFKFPDEVKKEAQEEYLKSIEQYKNGNTYSVPGEFVIGTGINN
jgi:ubiquinone/menaquinone biosynthesis C-methylase UbiE